jgi:acyl carrier protein
MTYPLSRDDILAGITDVLHKVASIDPAQVTPEQSLADLSLDSATTLETVVNAEERFGLIIPDDVTARFQTVGDIVDYVERAAVLTFDQAP